MHNGIIINFVNDNKNLHEKLSSATSTLTSLVAHLSHSFGVATEQLLHIHSREAWAFGVNIID